MRPSIINKNLNYSASFSQGWLATPQDVLHADWHDVWHSPQPPSLADFSRSLVSTVTILVMLNNLPCF
jgi:hypothetical protein